MGSDNVTVRFVDATTPTPLDLTGFGAGDKIIIDAKTNTADYYGLSGDIFAVVTNGGFGGFGAALSAFTSYTYTPEINTGTGFAIYYFQSTPDKVSGCVTPGAGMFANSKSVFGTLFIGNSYFTPSLSGTTTFGGVPHTATYKTVSAKSYQLAVGLTGADYEVEVLYPAGFEPS